MEHPFPYHSRRIAKKPHLPPKSSSSRKMWHRSTEFSTISTHGATSSSHIPELEQVVFTNPSSSNIVKTESSQLPVVMIHPISETIPPGVDVVQPEVDLDPVFFY